MCEARQTVHGALYSLVFRCQWTRHGLGSCLFRPRTEQVKNDGSSGTGCLAQCIKKFMMKCKWGRELSVCHCTHYSKWLLEIQSEKRWQWSCEIVGWHRQAIFLTPSVASVSVKSRVESEVLKTWRHTKRRHIATWHVRIKHSWGLRGGPPVWGVFSGLSLARDLYLSLFRSTSPRRSTNAKYTRNPTLLEVSCVGYHILNFL